MKESETAQSGQALIELIIFLPLMLTIYSVIGGFASSINGSINQQKVSRSYFYYRLQNNSNFPGPKTSVFGDWRQFGMYFIGWRDYFKGEDSPVMPCYKISIPFKDRPNDNCEAAYTEQNTLWLRVGTVYGACGQTYIHQDGSVYPVTDFPAGADFKQSFDRNSCVIRK